MSQAVVDFELDSQQESLDLSDRQEARSNAFHIPVGCEACMKQESVAIPDATQQTLRVNSKLEACNLTGNGSSPCAVEHLPWQGAGDRESNGPLAHIPVKRIRCESEAWAQLRSLLSLSLSKCLRAMLTSGMWCLVGRHLHGRDRGHQIHSETWRHECFTAGTHAIDCYRSALV